MTPSMSEVDQVARKALSEAILGHSDPAGKLLEALEELDSRQDLATQAALFDEMLTRVDVRHYWVFYRMSRVYAELGRDEAGVLLASMAIQMHPDWDASFQPFRDTFRAFSGRGDYAAALDIFHRQVALHPERPIAERHEIEGLTRALGIQPATAMQSSVHRPSLGHSALEWGRRDHRVVEAETRAASPVHAVGGVVPHGLRSLGGSLQRWAIDVVELADGELLICNDAVAVRNGQGSLLAELSVCSYPDLVCRRVLEPPPGLAVEDYAVDEAVLILDVFPPPNLAHFLLDQLSRLELYRRAGVDLSQALVVGPELRVVFQRELAARAGIGRLLGTDRVARLRARRLWVSGNCRALQHPAHYGAGWAIEHARALLGGRGTSGDRRLYLSRAESTVRRVVNEAELAEALAQRGFETIVPGTLPYAEQLAIFRKASHVVGAHGAALTHIVLCPPGARLLELFHPLYGSWAYAMLAADCGLDYTAMVGRDGTSDAAELNDPGLVDLEAALFGERHLRIDVAALRPWLDTLG